jgi:hypothetical protein
METVTVDQLHRRMGHIAPQAARDLVKKGLVEGIALDDSGTPTFCDSCAHAKTTRKPIHCERQTPRSKRFGDLIYSDL